MRIDKTNYYLDIAETVSERSTCLRRQWGCIIVNNDQVISSGYNGSPRGYTNCNIKGECIRNKLNIPRGTKYELCYSVHSEQNAIINASREQMIGSNLYLVGKDIETGEYVSNSQPCSLCKKMIINSGIKNVYIRDNKNNFRKIEVDSWLETDDISGENGY